ncbi:hypothetical protein D0T50_00230 [Bacteroides sp. 214]|uniref:hypothetical protein n=1 Tax=Bacteroides sp. 214 TaxID=2302935 RepID=UPI0013D1C82D|nr:hypothetical protein [Bacteroides sp. 214]NDW11315.1 hypothetical protein [Bacteroides sp. 214]
MMKTLTRYIFMLFALLPIASYGQINLRPGYIITNDNDTLHGSIDFRTPERNASQCVFRDESTGKTTTYYPGNIYGYRFTDDGKFYVTRTLTIGGVEGVYFLEYIIQGIISMYYLPTHGDCYFFEEADGRLVEVSKEDKIVTLKNGKSGVQRDTRYVGLLTYLFRDSEEVKKKVEGIGFNQKELVEITKEYHNNVCKTGEECIVFETKNDNKYYQFTFTLLAGVKKHSSRVKDLKKRQNINYLNATSPSFGLDVGMLIPRFSRVFSFHVGLEGSSFRGEYCIPNWEFRYLKFKQQAFVLENNIGVRYSPLHKRIQPFIEGGYAHSILMYNSLKQHYEELTDSGSKKLSKSLDTEQTSFTMGFYIGGGVAYKLGKHVIMARSVYRKKNWMASRLNTLEATLGFTF